MMERSRLDEALKLPVMGELEFSEKGPGRNGKMARLEAWSLLAF